MRAKLILLLLTLSSVAMAAPGPKDTAYVGLHAGLVLPQLGSELGTTGGGTLDVGYRVWKGLVPYLSIGYAQPVVDGAADDTRLAATSYTTSVTQRELQFTAGALWRQGFGRGAIVGGAGVRAYLLESIATGSAGGEEFLENRETSTRVGAVGLVGGELRLGPGAAALTLEVGGSALEHIITGQVATTALGVEIGYRFFFR